VATTDKTESQNALKYVEEIIIAIAEEVDLIEFLLALSSDAHMVHCQGNTIHKYAP
jgi:hypothetical protein